MSTDFGSSYGAGRSISNSGSHRCHEMDMAEGPRLRTAGDSSASAIQERNRGNQDDDFLAWEPTGSATATPGCSSKLPLIAEVMPILPEGFSLQPLLQPSTISTPAVTHQLEALSPKQLLSGTRRGSDSGAPRSPATRSANAVAHFEASIKVLSDTASSNSRPSPQLQQHPAVKPLRSAGRRQFTDSSDGTISTSGGRQISVRLLSTIEEEGDRSAHYASSTASVSHLSTPKSVAKSHNSGVRQRSNSFHGVGDGGGSFLGPRVVSPLWPPPHQKSNVILPATSLILAAADGTLADHATPVSRTPGGTAPASRSTGFAAATPEPRGRRQEAMATPELTALVEQAGEPQLGDAAMQRQQQRVAAAVASQKTMKEFARVLHQLEEGAMAVQRRERTQQPDKKHRHRRGRVRDYGGQIGDLFGQPRALHGMVPLGGGEIDATDGASSSSTSAEDGAERPGSGRHHSLDRWEDDREGRGGEADRDHRTSAAADVRAAMGMSRVGLLRLQERTAREWVNLQRSRASLLTTGATALEAEVKASQQRLQVSRTWRPVHDRLVATPEKPQQAKADAEEILWDIQQHSPAPELVANVGEAQNSLRVLWSSPESPLDGTLRAVEHLPPLPSPSKRMASLVHVAPQGNIDLNPVDDDVAFSMSLDGTAALARGRSLSQPLQLTSNVEEKRSSMQISLLSSTAARDEARRYDDLLARKLQDLLRQSNESSIYGLGPRGGGHARSGVGGKGHSATKRSLKANPTMAPSATPLADHQSTSSGSHSSAANGGADSAVDPAGEKVSGNIIIRGRLGESHITFDDAKQDVSTTVSASVRDRHSVLTTPQHYSSLSLLASAADPRLLGSSTAHPNAPLSTTSWNMIKRVTFSDKLPMSVPPERRMMDGLNSTVSEANTVSNQPSFPSPLQKQLVLATAATQPFDQSSLEALEVATSEMDSLHKSLGATVTGRSTGLQGSLGASATVNSAASLTHHLSMTRSEVGAPRTIQKSPTRVETKPKRLNKPLPVVAGVGAHSAALLQHHILITRRGELEAEQMRAEEIQRTCLLLRQLQPLRNHLLESDLSRTIDATVSQRCPSRSIWNNESTGKKRGMSLAMASREGKVSGPIAALVCRDVESTLLPSEQLPLLLRTRPSLARNEAELMTEEGVAHLAQQLPSKIVQQYDTTLVPSVSKHPHAALARHRRIVFNEAARIDAAYRLKLRLEYIDVLTELTQRHVPTVSWPSVEAALLHARSILSEDTSQQNFAGLQRIVESNFDVLQLGQWPVQECLGYIAALFGISQKTFRNWMVEQYQRMSNSYDFETCFRLVDRDIAEREAPPPVTPIRITVHFCRHPPLWLGPAAPSLGSSTARKGSSVSGIALGKGEIFSLMDARGSVVSDAASASTRGMARRADKDESARFFMRFRSEGAVAVSTAASLDGGEPQRGDAEAAPAHRRIQNAVNFNGQVLTLPVQDINFPFKIELMRVGFPSPVAEAEVHLQRFFKKRKLSALAVRPTEVPEFTQRHPILVPLLGKGCRKTELKLLLETI